MEKPAFSFQSFDAHPNFSRNSINIAAAQKAES